MAVTMNRGKTKAKATAAPAKVTHTVMLANKCKRYLYKDVLYIAGREYEVDTKLRDELFRLHDEYYARYFYDADFIIRREAKRKAASRAANARKSGEEVDTEDFLTDDEGNPIGVNGAPSSRRKKADEDGEDTDEGEGGDEIDTAESRVRGARGDRVRV